MLKIYENGLMEKLENHEGISELIFTKENEKDIKEIFANTEFKYRPISEYVFNELEFYKMYTCDYTEKPNIVRLVEGELDYYRNMLKISKLLKEKMTIDEIMEYDIIFDDFRPEYKILFETEKYIISEHEYDDDENYQKTVHVKIKEDESLGYDYKEWFINNQIDKKLSGIQLEEKQRIEVKKYLRENFNKIVNNVGSFDIKIENIFTKTDEDIEKFATLATATTEWLEHSWAGEEGNRVKFDLIHGSIKFGKDSTYTYSNNGDIREPEYSIEIVDFKTDDEIIFMREDYDYYGYNNRDGESSDEYGYTLVIYNI